MLFPQQLQEIQQDAFIENEGETVHILSNFLAALQTVHLKN